ncbi:hypothetical protein GH714_013038 [Hevea brasiliensis]|uniref:Uncharacterized protein n=1 Tax=Hevea brasiliensis TaxID=3981 RepID=A0A6A6MZ13_HEVBR|nr:hypothetical protein GH714_013038 [Hevea brasiliensis]
MAKASVVTTQISFASAASIIATKLQYSSTKNTAAISDMKARDWTPVDDDIEVYLCEFLDKYPTPRKEVDAFIHKILHAPTARKRLPVFSEFCTSKLEIGRPWMMILSLVVEGGPCVWSLKPIISLAAVLYS